MKRLFFVLLFGFIVQALPAQFSAMTYNIRYSTPNDGENWWEQRKEWVAEVVDYYAPDVLGIQEGLERQVAYLDSVFSTYQYVGVGRDDGIKAGEFSAVFYNSDKLEVLDSGTFWLSETPSKPSYGWGANYRRVCSWALFKNKHTQEEVLVFNAHFDHEVALARLNSAKLMHQKVLQLTDGETPVVLMGDFNATPNADPIQFLKEHYADSKIVSVQSPFGPEGTYNGFDVNHPLDRRIDYIFVNDKITVERYAVIAESRYGRTPSDHLPVLVDLKFK